MKKIIYASLLAVSALVSRAQQPDFSLKDSVNQPIVVENYNYMLMEETFLVRINEERYKKKIPLLKEIMMLKKTAYDQALSMSDLSASELVDPGERSVLYGGTRNVTEITGRASLGTGPDKSSFIKICNSIMSKWLSSNNITSILFDPSFEFVGVSSTTNFDGTKLFVSVVLGNKYSTAPKLDESANKYISTKTFELEPFNAKACSKCNKVDKIEELAKGLVIEGNTIYLTTDNFKIFKQFIKSEEDGLAVDIVNMKQFACGRDNIVNYKVPNKGIMLQPLFFGDILQKNLEDAKSGKGKIKLGNLPKDMNKDSVELNLIIIIQNKICKNLFKPNLSIAQQTYKYSPAIQVRKDPRFPNDQPMSLEKIDKAYSERICRRCADPYYTNAFNLYNCLISTLQLGQVTTDVQYQQAKTKYDKIASMGKISADSIFSLEMALYFQALDSKQISTQTRTEITNKINDIEPTLLSLNNTLAFYSFFMANNNYKKALQWLDQVILSTDVPEDLLFTYLSISALYSSQLNGSTFAKVMEIARSRNAGRFCQVFGPGGLSIQVLENQNVKEIVCKTCPLAENEGTK